jgi:hypothetical protein
VIGMKVEDYFANGKRWWVRLYEKGGKVHEMPAHHKLEQYLDEYLEPASIRDQGKTPLFRSTTGRTGLLTDRSMHRVDAYLMVRRRTAEAGLKGKLGCHMCRATGITAYLEGGGTLENAQKMAAHSSPRTTKLYDRRGGGVTLDEVERINILLATGAILLATTQFLPQLVEQDFGYTATWAGLVLSPGGLVTMVMMFVVGRLSAKVQPKYLIVVGAVLIALSMYDLTNTYGDLGFWFFARSRMLLGVGLPLIFLPITTASYDGIPAVKTDQASALLNAARNTGGSIGISVVNNVLAHREQFHQSRLVDNAIPSSIQYQDTLQQVTNYFVARGSALAQAHQQAIHWIGQQVQNQASFLGYMDAFWVLMLISLAAVPLALALRKVKLGGAVHVGH